MLLKDILPATLHFLYRFTLCWIMPGAFTIFYFICYPMKFLFPNAFEWIFMQLYQHLLSIIPSWMQFFDSRPLWESGADISKLKDRRAIVMINHQSTADVPLLFYAFAVKPPVLSQILWVIDNSFKWVSFGWVSQLHGDFFILQGNSVRSRQLENFADHLRQFYVNCQRRWIAIFPEGGFLYKRRETSQEYARKHGYVHLEHVTLPRVGALQTALEICGQSSQAGDSQLEYVIDVTLGYPYENGAVNELDIIDVLAGRRAQSAAHVHYRVFPVSDIPRTSTHELTQWMYARWAEKEVLLTHLYQHGTFPTTSNDTNSQSPVPLLKKARKCQLTLQQCVWMNVVYFSLAVLVYYLLPFKLLAFLTTGWL